MTTLSDAADPAITRRAWRNIAVLSWSQAALGAQLPVLIILGGLAGGFLAPEGQVSVLGFSFSGKLLATLPISLQMIAGMVSAMPASLYMGRVGRRAGFLTGAGFGALAGFLGMRALTGDVFALLCAAHMCAGVYQTFQGYFRFAATDTAPDALKPRAVSYVLAGGLVSALVGPEIAKQTNELLAPVPFAGAYGAIIAINIVGALGLFALDIPRPPRVLAGTAGAGRSLGEILREPPVIVAIICGMVSYALMILVMTSTPIAMIACAYATSDAADVVRWHAVAMFAPSFFTGSLITRFGHRTIISIGLALLASCALVALSGIEIEKFYLALILLGLGWNFGFIGATSLLASQHTPAERSTVQGFNDFCVFGLVSIASLGSGVLMGSLGWEAVNLAMIPFLTLAAGALIWLGFTPRRT